MNTVFGRWEPDVAISKKFIGSLITLA